MPTREIAEKYGRYKNDKRICANCGKVFWIQKWIPQRFCSQQCGVDSHKGKTYEERECPECGGNFKVESWKKQKFCSLKCGVDFNRGKPRKKRTKSSNKAKRNRATRTYANGKRIAVHRYLMEQKLGRRLKSSETVHHIDMNMQNNVIENLWLYENESKHHKGHHSLGKLVFRLLKEGIVKFVKGKYILGGGRGKGTGRKG